MTTPTSSSSPQLYVQRLVNLFHKQRTQGCDDAECPASICYTHCKRTSDRPLRRYTERSARAAAFWLSSLDNPLARLCPSVLANIDIQDIDELVRTDAVVPEGGKDPKSFTQHVFDTDALRDFVDMKQSSISSIDNSTWQEFDIAYNATLRYLRSDPQWASLGAAAFIRCCQILEQYHNSLPVDEDPRDPAYLRRPMFEVVWGSFSYGALVDEQEQTATRAIIHLLYHLLCLAKNDCSPAGLDGSGEENKVARIMLKIIRMSLLDFQDNNTDLGSLIVQPVDRQWTMVTPIISAISGAASRLFMQSWDGESALRAGTMAAKTLVVLTSFREWVSAVAPNYALDLWFKMITPPRSGDPVEFATKWLNKNTDDQDDSEAEPTYLYLLEYPWLFSTAKIVDFFRACCHRRMENAVDEAQLNIRLLLGGMAWQPQALSIGRLLNGKLETATTRNMGVQVHRDKVIDDLFDQLWRREKRELLRPLKVRIVNEGEEGQDFGGVAQEMFQLAMEELLHPDYGMFTVDPTTRMTWYNPSSLEPPHKWQVVGVIFALAVHNGYVLPVTFPLVFYRQLLHGSYFTPLRLTLEDIQDGWPELEKSFRDLLDSTEPNLEEVLSRPFVFTFENHGQVIDIDLTDEKRLRWSQEEYRTPREGVSDNAPLINNDNRTAYIKAYIEEQTYNSVKTQITHLKIGFWSLFHPSMSRILTPTALHYLVAGHHTIDTHALETFTTYDGYSPVSPAINCFWRIIHSYSDTEKRQFLEFVTASDRLPVNGAKGVGLVIQRNGGDEDRLPTSVTCYSRLLLPEYEGEEKTRDKLALAFRECRGFGLQ